MKIINKKTGETIDLSNLKESPKSNTDKSESRIKERGTIQGSVKEGWNSGSVMKKIGAVGEVADAPFAAIESGISNPAMEIQKGNVSLSPSMASAGMVGATPRDMEAMGKVIKEAVLGLTLQKQAQYGDIMKNAGYNPLLADSMGLVLHVSPVKVYSEVAKTFGAISKLSDKAMLKAGNNLVNAVNQAKTSAGIKLNQEFAKQADNVPVDGLKFIEDVAKLPEPIMNKAEAAFGDLAEFANGLTVKKVREFKSFLGKIKPNSYAQAEKGIQESLDVKDLNQVYSNLKKRIFETLSDKGSGLDKKSVDYLMKLEDTFAEVSDAGRYIRKAITNPTIKKPTKVGEFSKQVNSETDSTARISLDTIKKTSRQAMSRINSAMKEIEGFNRGQAVKSFVSHATKAAIYGGVAGGIGGRILRGVQGNSND